MKQPEFIKEWLNLAWILPCLKFWCAGIVLLCFYIWIFSLGVFEWIGKAYKAGKQGKK